MWDDLPSDLLAHIFFFLSPDSLACASSSCRRWRACAKWGAATAAHHQPPWFLAMHVRNRGPSCYTHNAVLDRWHSMPLDFCPLPIRLIAPIASLLLCKQAVAPYLSLALCNPFTRQYKVLPKLNTPRANPAVGVAQLTAKVGGGISIAPTHFRVYVAGGVSVSPYSGSTYLPSFEMYDSKLEKWQTFEEMPLEFAVRMTVWTPNESVYSNGVLYWITSARAYSMMGLDTRSGTWMEVKVPHAERLECAALVRRSNQVALVGGMARGRACVWELRAGSAGWDLVEVIPYELSQRFLVGQGSWGSTKCVGSDEAIYLYRDSACGMLVWREGTLKGKWEWNLFEGCLELKKEGVSKFPIKGMLIHPSLSTLCMFHK